MKDANLDVNISGTESINDEITADSYLNTVPEIVKHLDATFGIKSGIDISIQSPPLTNAEFGSIYVVEGQCKVLYATTETWNSNPLYVSLKGYIYIYSDRRQDEAGNNLPGIKIGDGNAYLIDLPFQDDVLFAHIEDVTIHVTQEEKNFWNNKVRCYMADNNTQLIFTTD